MRPTGSGVPGPESAPDPDRSDARSAARDPGSRLRLLPRLTSMPKPGLQPVGSRPDHRGQSRRVAEVDSETAGLAVGGPERPGWTAD